MACWGGYALYLDPLTTHLINEMVNPSKLFALRLEPNYSQRRLLINGDSSMLNMSVSLFGYHRCWWPVDNNRLSVYQWFLTWNTCKVYRCCSALSFLTVGHVQLIATAWFLTLDTNAAMAQCPQWIRLGISLNSLPVALHVVDPLGWSNKKITATFQNPSQFMTTLAY